MGNSFSVAVKTLKHQFLKKTSSIVQRKEDTPSILTPTVAFEQDEFDPALEQAPFL